MRLKNQPASKNFYADDLSFVMSPYRPNNNVIRNLPEGPQVHESLQRALDLYYQELLMRQRASVGMVSPYESWPPKPQIMPVTYER